MIKTLLLHIILDQSIESFFNGLILTFGSIDSGEYYIGMKFNKIVVEYTSTDLTPIAHLASLTHNFYDGVIVANDGINLVIEYNHLKKIIKYVDDTYCNKTQYQSCGANDALVTSIYISSIANCI